MVVRRATMRKTDDQSFFVFAEQCSFSQDWQYDECTEEFGVWVPRLAPPHSKNNVSSGYQTLKGIWKPGNFAWIKSFLSNSNLSEQIQILECLKKLDKRRNLSFFLCDALIGQAENFSLPPRIFLRSGIILFYTFT